MADVTLAEANGNVWLVDGEPFLDDLLANTLAAEVTIEIIPCGSRDEVIALWQRNAGDAAFGCDPWVIHPGIVRRIKNQLGPQSVGFSPWSAMLDAAANDAIGGTAAWLGRNSGARLTLRQFSHTEAPPGLGDLQRLRGQLVAAAFDRAGVAADRIEHETIATDNPTDADRLELVSGETKAG